MSLKTSNKMFNHIKCNSRRTALRRYCATVPIWMLIIFTLADLKTGKFFIQFPSFFCYLPNFIFCRDSASTISVFSIKYHMNEHTLQSIQSDRYRFSKWLWTRRMRNKGKKNVFEKKERKIKVDNFLYAFSFWNRINEYRVPFFILHQTYPCMCIFFLSSFHQEHISGSHTLLFYFIIDFFSPPTDTQWIESHNWNFKSFHLQHLLCQRVNSYVNWIVIILVAVVVFDAVAMSFFFLLQMIFFHFFFFSYFIWMCVLLLWLLLWFLLSTLAIESTCFIMWQNVILLWSIIQISHFNAALTWINWIIERHRERTIKNDKIGIWCSFLFYISCINIWNNTKNVCYI